MLKPQSVRHKRSSLFIALLGLAALAGCAEPMRFPATPLSETQTPEGAVRAYAVDAKGGADFFTTQGADGRIFRIAYDTSGGGKPDTVVDLDEIHAPDCRHVIIILDGMPYGVVEAYRQKGGLRLFYPPSRMVSTCPAMTDLALTDAFAAVRCYASESIHFDHRANRLVGGTADYISMKNERWADSCDYRSPPILDDVSYVFPEPCFRQGLGAILERFHKRDRSVLVCYLISTAGLATKEGEAGMIKILEGVDRLSQQLMYETHGLIKITMFSDHGHTMTRAVRLDPRPLLIAKGWHISDRLDGPRDVVPIEFGLITVASFAAKDRAGLAADLVQCKGFRLAYYEDGPAVAVRSPDGLAFVERRGGRYRYRATQGDPLQLLPVFEKLKTEGKLDADGFADDRPLFEATATHVYPDACNRLWRAFHGLVEDPPDVMADLDRGYYAGSAVQAAIYGAVASTHGDLERTSSTGVILSTIGPMSPALRHRDLTKAMQELTGRPWPEPRQGRGE
ncbi:MAG: hypothetical protein NT049_01585 [Planctomycetota bacterium]|nr:hypothetical protein [Planctomycetota bacterium]